MSSSSSSVASEYPFLDSDSIQRRIEFSATRELAGPIIDWCNSISSPRVKEIRLHKSSASQTAAFFAVIVLEDESSYCLRRQRQDVRRVSQIADSHDTIEKASFQDMNSYCLISITFTSEHYPELLLVFAICRGIQCISSELRQLVFANSEFFAYALLSNLARHSLQPKSMPHDPENELEALWNDVYLFIRDREFGFREKAIANHTQNMVQYLLRIATREKASRIVRPAGDADPVEATRHTLTKLASAIARVEVSTSRHEHLQLSKWDRAWTQRWNTAWDHRWNENWTIIMRSQDASLGLKALGNLGITVTRPSVDGSASGRAAGRAPIRVPETLVAIAPPESVLVNTPAIAQEAVVLDSFAESSVTKSAETPQILVTSSEAEEVQSKRYSDAGSSPNHDHSRGNALCLKHCSIWTSTCEVAAEIGWADIWGKAVELGERAAKRASNPEEIRLLETSTSSNKLRTEGLRPKFVRHLSDAFSSVPKLAKSGRRLSMILTGNNSNPESIDRAAPLSPTSNDLPVLNKRPPLRPEAGGHSKSISHNSENGSRLKLRIKESLLSQNVVVHHHGRLERAAHFQERRIHERTKFAALKLVRMPVAEQHLDKSDLESRAISAWNSAVHASNSPEKNRIDHAQWEWLGATRRPGTIVSPPILGEEQERQVLAKWKENFRTTWKAVWIDSWMAAWQSSWEYGWEEASEKAVNFGMSKVLKEIETQDIKFLLELRSFQQVKKIIEAQKTYLGALGRMHLMCKELNHLHSTLAHSIPISHEDVMIIRVAQSKKPWVRLVNQVTEGVTQSASQSRTVRHFELQHIIEEQSRHRFEQEKIPHTAFIQGMAEVWEFTAQERIKGQDNDQNPA
ncbi:hypothetical protein RhiJN_22409 [Ceratobasidium sp. AG-Ba]|nr:hypothetical protein RhiJN_22409 [Ceratobasidium sp. AG-Ba]